MSGRGQHYLPKFLQRPFSHPKDGKGEFVFVHTRSKSFEPNIAGIGKERDFYSDQADTSLDDAITTGEDLLAETLRSLLGTNPALVEPEDSARLLAAISMRTKAMRQAMNGMLPPMMKALSEKLKDGKILRDKMREQMHDPKFIDEAIQKELKKHPRMNREAKAKFADQAKRYWKTELDRREENLLSQAKVTIEEFLRMFAGKAGEVADRSFLKAMKNDPHMPQRVEWLKDFDFEVMPATGDDEFVLGDCGVVGFYSDNTFRLPVANVDDGIQVEAFLMPMSPCRCLVARRPGCHEDFTASIVNTSQISLSREFFISGIKDGPMIEIQRGLINTAASFLTEDEMLRIVLDDTPKEQH